MVRAVLCDVLMLGGGNPSPILDPSRKNERGDATEHTARSPLYHRLKRTEAECINPTMDSRQESLDESFSS